MQQIMTVKKARHDVIVVGGGIAGVSAAVAAGRAGASVLLIEKGIHLGGLATVGLISWYEPLCDGEGHKMIGGIAEELIRLASSCGFDDLPEEWGGENSRERKSRRYSTHFSPTLFALELDRYVRQAGVELLFDTRATYPIMEGKVCRGMLVENVGGRAFYPADVVIDATGDATVAFRAGIPCEVGDNYLCYVTHGFDHESAKQYAEDGNLVKFRCWRNSGASLDGMGQPEGMKLFHGVTGEDVTEFLLIGRERMLAKYDALDRKSCDMMMIPAMPQYRKVRRIIGKTNFDGTEEGRVYEDSIGAIGDFRHPGRRFTVPYSALYAEDFPNILTAGRIISAGGDGWEITRVIPVCALTGHAAGIAAAMATKREGDVTALPYAELRTALEAADVQFDIGGVPNC